MCNIDVYQLVPLYLRHTMKGGLCCNIYVLLLITKRGENTPWSIYLKYQHKLVGTGNTPLCKTLVYLSMCACSIRVHRLWYYKGSQYFV